MISVLTTTVSVLTPFCFTECNASRLTKASYLLYIRHLLLDRFHTVISLPHHDCVGIRGTEDQIVGDLGRDQNSSINSSIAKC
jgi:hypothetical protein